jgi:hypothetical protein
MNYATGHNSFTSQLLIEHIYLLQILYIIYNIEKKIFSTNFNIQFSFIVRGYVLQRCKTTGKLFCVILVRCTLKRILEYKKKVISHSWTERFL